MTHYQKVAARSALADALAEAGVVSDLKRLDVEQGTRRRSRSRGSSPSATISPWPYISIHSLVT